MFYIEYTIFFTHIEIALLILFTGIKTAKSFVNRIGVSKSLSLAVEMNTDLQMVDLVYDNTMREPEELDPSGSFLTIPMEELKAKEQWHIVKDRLGKWHIGLVIEVFDSENCIVLCVDVLVSASLFFQFPIKNAKIYVIEMAEDDDSIILASDLRHNICGSTFQLNDIYDLPDTPVIIKTYWIRIIQRRWKTIYAERMRRLMLRGGLKAQRQFELSGKYGIGLGNGLRGMLSTVTANNTSSLLKSQQI